MNKNTLIIIVVSVVFCFLSSVVYAVDGDNLSLWGYVTGVDPDMGRIEIDVKKGRCPGLKTFSYDTEKIEIDPGIVGKRIHFVIDTSECDALRINIVSYYIRGETK